MKLSLFVLSAVSLLGAAFGCCVFNGQTYEKGETIENDCIILTCQYNEKKGVYYWETDDYTTDKCDRCCLQNDPHIFTFDASPTYYDYHGLCRYSLAQYIDDWANLPTSDVPAFGVYGSFETCSFGGSPPPSCLDITSYQLSGSLYDVVHVNHDDPFTIFNDSPGASTTIISSEPTQVVIGTTVYQLLAWRSGSCLRLLGPQFFMEICKHSVCIWAPRKYLKHLGGLCGNYNGYPKDDHTDSSNEVHTWDRNPVEFPPTWKTDIQFNPKCQDNKEQIPCDKGLFEMYLEMCKEKLADCRVDDATMEQLIETCAIDLCAFPKQEEEWLEIAIDNCNHEAFLQKQTLPTKG